MIKKIVLGLIVAMLVLQFVGPSRPTVRSENPGDIMRTTETSLEISGLVRAACYDCHSMETKYPWYGYVAPASWYLFEHIEHGREELNFSMWQELDKRKKLKALKDIQEVMEDNEMPLDAYVDMHPEADLTDDQKEMIITWARELAKGVLKNQ